MVSTNGVLESEKAKFVHRKAAEYVMAIPCTSEAPPFSACGSCLSTRASRQSTAPANNCTAHRCNGSRPCDRHALDVITAKMADTHQTATSTSRGGCPMAKFDPPMSWTCLVVVSVRPSASSAPERLDSGAWGESAPLMRPVDVAARPAHSSSLEEEEDGPRATTRLPAGRMRAALESLREFSRHMTAATLSESALSGGTALVWPWRGARCLAPFVPGASCSRASVSSVGGS
eukprot:scaffold28954_cov144-Isochrysis_galbana.AAC.1